MRRKLVLLTLLIISAILLVFIHCTQKQVRPAIPEQKVHFPLKKDNITVVRVEPAPGKVVGRNHFITIWVKPPDPGTIRASITVHPEPEYIMEHAAAWVPGKALGYTWAVTADRGVYTVNATVFNRKTGERINFSWSYYVK